MHKFSISQHHCAEVEEKDVNTETFLIERSCLSWALRHKNLTFPNVNIKLFSAAKPSKLPSMQALQFFMLLLRAIAYR